MPETKVTVELPDGAELKLENGATGADAAAAIGPGLAKAALAIKADGELRDLSAPLSGGERIEIVTEKSPEALDLVRHDAAHVLAEAVLDLWPAAKISIGPPIADGFYYDIDFPDGERPGPEDLARIEERMREHIAADEPFELRELPAAEAIEHFRTQGQDYKVELIEDLVRDEGAETVTLYRNGPFEDLCRGPHGPSTGRIGAFKLTSLAASTAPLFTIRSNSTRTSSSWSWRASGITGSWAPSWTCSCCGRRRPGCPSGSPTAAPSWS